MNDPPTQDLDLFHDAPPSGVSMLPGVDELSVMMQLADRLAASSIVPRAYQQRPQDLLPAILQGRELGLGPMATLRYVNVIEGTPSLSAEGMLALIRRAGHSIVGDADETHGWLTAIRRDTGETQDFTYTLQEAADAGLCKIVDGRPVAKSRQGKPLPWQAHTRDLLWARAVSRCARRMFSDVLLGVTYVPEEVEAFQSPPPQIDGEIPTEEPFSNKPQPEVEVVHAEVVIDEITEMREELLHEISALMKRENAVGYLRDAWKASGLGKAKTLKTEEEFAAGLAVVFDVDDQLNRRDEAQANDEEPF